MRRFKKLLYNLHPYLLSSIAMPEEAPALTSEQVRRDAVAGMVGLGFSHREASTLVEEITREQALASVEDVIRAVFERMQRG